MCISKFLLKPKPTQQIILKLPGKFLAINALIKPKNYLLNGTHMPAPSGIEYANKLNQRGTYSLPKLPNFVVS